MQLTSTLRRESAPVVGLLSALGTYAIYAHQLPQNADLRATPAHNDDAEAARKQAAIESTVLLGIIFAVTRDFNAFIIGGVATLLIDSSYKHANAVNPGTGRVDMSSGGKSITNVYPLADYDDVNDAA